VEEPVDPRAGLTLKGPVTFVCHKCDFSANKMSQLKLHEQAGLLRIWNREFSGFNSRFKPYCWIKKTSVFVLNKP
jgi:hypothetical protein